MAAVVRLEHPKNEAAIIALIDELNEWLQGEPELRRLFAIWIRALLLRRNKGAWALPKVQDLKELRMGLAEKVERWAKEHQERGRQEGRQEGMQEGLEKGRQKGQAEGAQQAQTLILQRLLARRFGELSPQILGKIQHASPRQVDAWIDRVLDAPTLEAIFDA